MENESYCTNNNNSGMASKENSKQPSYIPELKNTTEKRVFPEKSQTHNFITSPPKVIQSTIPNSLKIDPQAEKYHSIGYEFRQKGDYKTSIEYYTKALEITPNYFKALFNRGFAFDKLGECEKAVKDYTSALEIEPRNAFIYYNRGISLDKLKRFDEAIYNFTMAIQLEPNKADFYHNRGFAYRKKLDYENAINDYSKAIELSPEHFKVFL